MHPERYVKLVIFDETGKIVAASPFQIHPDGGLTGNPHEGMSLLELREMAIADVTQALAKSLPETVRNLFEKVDESCAPASPHLC